MSRTLGYPTTNLNPHYGTPYDDNGRPSQTDGRTNIMAVARRFVLTNASRAKKPMTECHPVPVTVVYEFTDLLIKFRLKRSKAKVTTGNDPNTS